jgi:hypothetical protein
VDGDRSRVPLAVRTLGLSVRRSGAASSRRSPTDRSFA